MTKKDIEIIINERTVELQKENNLLRKKIFELKNIKQDLTCSQNRLEYVKQIGALANSSLKLEEVLEYILKGTLEASGATAGMIFLKDQDSDTLTLRSSIGLSPAFVKEFRDNHVRKGEGLTGRIAESGNVIYVRESSSHDPRISREVIKKEDLNSFIGVPVFAVSDIVGVMNILSRPPKILSEQEITLAAAIGAYVGQAIRNAQQFEDRMRAEMKLLEYQKQLQSLTSKVSLIEENEKRRVASELHDGIGQPLALTKIKLGILNKNLSSEKNRATIKEIIQLIEQTITETRTLTFQLSPPILYELGLTQAIIWLIDEFRKNHNINITFSDDGSEKPFDNSTRFFLFQAVRELLVNIVKHSRSDSADLSISSTNRQLKIIIKDYGAGFSTLDTENGFGLFNIRERMKQINGSFEIISFPGKGTSVLITVPLKKENNSLNLEPVK